MLEADFLQFGQSGPGSLQFDRSTDQVQGSMKLLTFTVRFGSDAPNLSEDFPMILGDAVHNYRGALDHLTWELVRRFSTRLSPSDARKVQFPMHNNAKDFDNWKERRTPGVPDKPHRALLKRYQPYRSGDGPKAVRWLRRLSDHDKHRDLIPTVVAPKGVLIVAQASNPGVQLLRCRPLLTGPSVIKPGLSIAEIDLAAPLSLVGKNQLQVAVNTQQELFPRLSSGQHPGAVLAMISKTSAKIIDGLEALA